MRSKGKRQKVKGKRRGAIPPASSFFLLPFAFCLLCSAEPTTLPSAQPGFEVIGRIDSPAIPESSGLVMSRRHPGVYWTHNDSGNPPQIFAITREGKLIATYRIDAPNVDWEDIAIDDAGRLYLADIGNNSHNRWQVQVYRVAEPDPRGDPSEKSIKPDRIWRITFPGRPFDAESFFILGQDGFIIEKDLNGSQAGVYRFSLTSDERPVDLERVATLSERVPVTGADTTPDGKWLAIMTLAGPGIYEIDGQIKQVERGRKFQAIFLDPQVESVCFVPGGLLATTEGRRVIFFPTHGLAIPEIMNGKRP